MKSFPFDQARERASIDALEASLLPGLYGNGMLRGRAKEPDLAPGPPTVLC